MAKKITNIGKVSIYPRGDWNNLTADYEYLDLVQYLGSSFLVKLKVGYVPVGILPTNTTYFTKIVDKGDTGSQGIQGDVGATGANGVGVVAGGTAGQILTKVDATDYNTIWQDNYADWTSVVKHTVKNDGTALIAKGTAVYVTGSNGSNILVGKASNASEATSSKTMGLMQSEITTTGGTSTGFVITEGLIGGLNTAGATAGDPIWLGVDGALIYGLANEPYAPAHLVFIGIVTKVSAGSGEIFVKVQNGFELREIHDVDLVSSAPTNNQLLSFDSTSGLWKNKSVTTADIASSTNKNYVTDAQATVIGNTSGTNTGDNATNSLYSGLATSKQDALVSGTNIKTIEGQSLLGAGDIDLSKTDVGLSNVDNTADTAKPVSTAQQTALDLKADIAAATGTSVALTFTSDSVQGTIASPLTGNITGNITGAKLGVVTLVIHNHTTAPTFDSKYKKLSGSGSYVTGSINYIFCEYINDTEIIYSINQRT